MSSTDDFLFGGGSKSAKFDNVGDTISGVIESTEVKQQTDIGSGAGLTWDNGDPRMQLVVGIKTDQHDDDDDDGKRTIYVKGSKKPGSQSLHDAVAQAVRAAGAKGIEAGGTISVTFVGTEPAATRGFNDRKKYSATYAAPDKAAQSAGFLEPQAAEAPQAPTPAAPAGFNETQLAALKAAGLSPEDVKANA